MNTRSKVLATVGLLICGLALPNYLSAEKAAGSSMQVLYDSYHDTSLPVREYSTALPQGKIPPEIEHPRPRQILSGRQPFVADLAEQDLKIAPPVSAKVGLNLEGIPNSANGQGLEGIPSDNNLAAGATQVVEVINTAWQVFNKKTGKSEFGP